MIGSLLSIYGASLWTTNLENCNDDEYEANVVEEKNNMGISEEKTQLSTISNY